MTDELTRRPATELLALLDRRELSAAQLLELHLAQIERLDGVLNAIPTLAVDRARADAAASDQRRARGEARPLDGLPVAFKDLQATAGIRTTLGTRVLAEWIPDADSGTVARMRAGGVVGLGKSNVPEFGAGSQTYNDVFGPTRNPYDVTRTPGGSSGGAAAALAAGFVALADGSDYGGSLRNPASFCNVTGFRPTLGLVPADEPDDGVSLSTDGPLGRTVRDVGMLLSVLTAGGADGASVSRDPNGFRELDADVAGRRIALAPRFGGLPYEPPVSEVVVAAGATFASLGCQLELAEPDLTDADVAFVAPRHVAFRETVLEAVGDRVHVIKPELRWHVEEGARITASDLERAAIARGRIIRGFVEFMTGFDALVLPVSQVLPFPVEVTWPREIEGVPMPTYLDWMRSCWAISLLGAPAISVPAGFAGELPVGIQIVGRPGADRAVLQLAAAFEAASGELWRRPPYPLDP